MKKTTVYTLANKFLLFSVARTLYTRNNNIISTRLKSFRNLLQVLTPCFKNPKHGEKKHLLAERILFV